MNTYTQILYQIVFGTYRHEKTLQEARRDDLFRYMTGILKNKKCHLYRINGMEEHLHIATHIHPSVCLSDLIKDLKIASSDWIKRTGIFPNFSGWQVGYSAFTYSIKEKDKLIEYIKNQKERHRKMTAREELIELLREHGIDFDKRYLL